MKLLIKGGKIAGYAISAHFLVVVLYLTAALLTAIIPSPQNRDENRSASVEKNVEIILLSTLLHVDIAIPVDENIKEKFAFLQDDGIDLTNPKLRYLVIGWGAEQFYTMTKNLTDISPGPAFRAITGDKSVIHILPAGDVSSVKGARKLMISPCQLDEMTTRMLADLITKTDGKPNLMPGINFGLGDLFYKARGKFNIFNPCNVWAAKMLRTADVRTGMWTPTTYSLLWSINLHHIN